MQLQDTKSLEINQKIQPNVHVLVGRKRKKDDHSSGDTGIAILYESCRSLQGTAKVTGSIN